MPIPFRSLALGALVLATTSCTVHEEYPPALPAPRMPWDNSVAFIPTTPPPPELLPTVPPPVPSMVPSADEWALWRMPPQPAEVCTGKAKQRRCRQVRPSPVEEANAGALVRPTRGTTQGGSSAMIRYAYRQGAIYEIQAAPLAPTYLLLPPGQRLAAAPAINPDLFAVGVVQMGKDADRQETVVIRPLQAGQEPTITGLLLQSGLMIFCKLVTLERGGMVSVSWDLPMLAAPVAPELPVAQRPPKIDVGRLHTAYRIEPQGKLTPPWLPIAVFDDGTRTYVKFAEALTYTRAPGVFGLTPQGHTALVQSHMYVIPGQPERGAWLLVQGLWPALELTDSAGLTVKVVRQTPQTVARQEVSDAK